MILPGLGNNSKDYDPLAKAIRERGLLVDTAKIARLDWGRNAAGLLDLSYYRGTLQPRPVVDWCSPPSHLPCFVSVSKTVFASSSCSHDELVRGLPLHAFAPLDQSAWDCRA